MTNPAPSISDQRAFWNEWNAATREQRLSDISRDQSAAVLRWLQQMNRTDLDIIEVGCGAGWLCAQLTPFGAVTATDLSDEVLARARERVPDVRFVAGDFMALDFPENGYDAIIALEVLSHIPDHDAFIAKLARMLKPGGRLMLATQNRPVLQRYNRVPQQQHGQLRRWVDRAELDALLARHLTVRDIFSITPISNTGPMRLLSGQRARGFWRTLTGGGMEKALAHAGLGWTLMALAEKPA